MHGAFDLWVMQSRASGPFCPTVSRTHHRRYLRKLWDGGTTGCRYFSTDSGTVLHIGRPLMARY